MAQSKSKPLGRRVRQADEFALAAHQLAAAKDPSASIRNMVGQEPEQFVGRPYRRWRDEPELARRLNEALAASPK
ncbi:MAG: hypothetical protein ACM3ZV_09860 [Bacillota bacterium]